MSTAERMMGRLTARRGEKVLGLLAAAGVIATAVLGLWVTPPDADEGNVFRIIYVHVPSAWLAYLSFFIVFAASVAYLATKRIRWDRLAAASAEVGVLFIGLTLVLGSIWAKPTWGIWWTWDPRLTTTAVLFLIYVGYLAVRRLPDSPAKRARWSAAIGIVAFRRRADRASLGDLVAVAAPGPGPPARRAPHGGKHGRGLVGRGGGVHSAVRVPGDVPPAGRAPGGSGDQRGALSAARTAICPGRAAADPARTEGGFRAWLNSALRRTTSAT